MAYEQKDIDAGACLDVRTWGEQGDVEGHIKMVLKARVQKMLTSYFCYGQPMGPLHTLGVRILQGNYVGTRRFIIAGGALLHGVPKDIDVWPAPGENFLFLKADATDTSYLLNEPPIQVINKSPESLESLLRSFDFAHCQVGALVTMTQKAKNTAPHISTDWSTTYGIEVAYTPQWLAAMAVQGTFYTGGELWRSSLARVSSVARKLHLNDGEARALAGQIVDRQKLGPK